MDILLIVLLFDLTIVKTSAYERMLLHYCRLFEKRTTICRITWGFVVKRNTNCYKTQTSKHNKPTTRDDESRGRMKSLYINPVNAVQQELATEDQWYLDVTQAKIRTLSLSDNQVRGANRNTNPKPVYFRDWPVFNHSKAGGADSMIEIMRQAGI